MARKSNFDSKPAASAGSTSNSSAKTAKRVSTRSAGHRKVTSPEVEPKSDGALDRNAAMPSGSLSKLSQAVAAEFTREDVAKLAYKYWEMRGCQHGCAEEDWLRAEHELLSRG